MGVEDKWERGLYFSNFKSYSEKFGQHCASKRYTWDKIFVKRCIFLTRSDHVEAAHERMVFDSTFCGSLG